MHHVSVVKHPVFIIIVFNEIVDLDEVMIGGFICSQLYCQALDLILNT